MKFKTPGELPVMIGLTTGDTLTIQPDGSTEVPTRFRREAIARGCVPAGVGTDEPEAPKEKTKQELIVEAINKLLDADDEDSFTGDGKPKTTAIEKLVGFNLTAGERDAVWAIVEKTLKPVNDGE